MELQNIYYSTDKSFNGKNYKEFIIINKSLPQLLYSIKFDCCQDTIPKFQLVIGGQIVEELENFDTTRLYYPNEYKGIPLDAIPYHDTKVLIYGVEVDVSLSAKFRQLVEKIDHNVKTILGKLYLRGGLYYKDGFLNDPFDRKLHRV